MQILDQPDRWLALAARAGEVLNDLDQQLLADEVGAQQRLRRADVAEDLAVRRPDAQRSFELFLDELAKTYAFATPEAAEAECGVAATTRWRPSRQRSQTARI